MTVPEIESPQVEPQPTLEFISEFSLLLTRLDELRKQGVSEKGRFAVDIHNVIAPPSQQQIAAERRMINLVSQSTLPFDVQRALLVEAGLCREAPPESEFLQESGLVPNAFVGMDAHAYEVLASRMCFELGWNTTRAELTVEAGVMLRGLESERFFKLDDNARVIGSHITVFPKTA